MLSFVEDFNYIRILENKLQDCLAGKSAPKSKIVLKIESSEGVEFVRKSTSRQLRKYRLMAARDDLMIQIGGLKMPEALQTIIRKDPQAICASRLMLGFEQVGAVTMADISDLLLMQRLFGYRHFMTSDGLSRKHFGQVMDFWKEYIAVYP